MALFRKKPVIVEATQWNSHGDHPAVTSIPYNFPRDDYGWCPTLEGGHVVTPGDWIITGVKGENYPCKPDIFAATYEPAAIESELAPAAPTMQAMSEERAALVELRPQLREVEAERVRQDGKWGGPDHDDGHTTQDFVQLIQDYAAWARVMAGMNSPDKARRRLVQVAALAIAEVERMDRARALVAQSKEAK